MSTHFKSRISKTLSQAESVRKGNKNASPTKSSFAKDNDSHPEKKSPAFLRRYGRTYSPYGNLTPVNRKFGKTYSGRGNLKSHDSTSNQSSQNEPEKPNNESVGVENAVPVQDSVKNAQSYTFMKVNSNSNLTCPKKVMVENPASKLEAGSGKQNIINLPTQNIKLKCDRSTKKMIVLNNSSSGSPVVTLYFVPNSEATTSTVSNNNGRDNTKAIGGKPSLKLQPHTVNKNRTASSSVIFVDQAMSGTSQTEFKDSNSQRKNTLSGSNVVDRVKSSTSQTESKYLDSQRRSNLSGSNLVDRVKSNTSQTESKYLDSHRRNTLLGSNLVDRVKSNTSQTESKYLDSHMRNTLLGSNLVDQAMSGTLQTEFKDSDSKRKNTLPVSNLVDQAMSGTSQSEFKDSDSLQKNPLFDSNLVDQVISHTSLTETKDSDSQGKNTLSSSNLVDQAMSGTLQTETKDSDSQRKNTLPSSNLVDQVISHTSQTETKDSDSQRKNILPSSNLVDRTMSGTLQTETKDSDSQRKNTLSVSESSHKDAKTNIVADEIIHLDMFEFQSEVCILDSSNYLNQKDILSVPIHHEETNYLNLENSNLSISDNMKLRAKEKDDSHLDLIVKGKLISKDFKSDAIAKKKKKNNVAKEKQVMKKNVKQKVKQTDLTCLVDLNNTSFQGDCNKKVKKIVKDKKMLGQKKLSKKEKILNSQKKRERFKSEKQKFSKKKDKLLDKIRSPSLPKLKKYMPIVTTEEEMFVTESSEKITFDSMPVLEDATKIIPLNYDVQTMPVLQELVKPGEEQSKFVDQVPAQGTETSLLNSYPQSASMKYGSLVAMHMAKNTSSEMLISSINQEEKPESPKLSLKKIKAKINKNKLKSLKSLTDTNKEKLKLSTDIDMKRPKLLQLSVDCDDQTMPVSQELVKPEEHVLAQTPDPNSQSQELCKISGKSSSLSQQQKVPSYTGNKASLESNMENIAEHKSTEHDAIEILSSIDQVKYERSTKLSTKKTKEKTMLSKSSDMADTKKQNSLTDMEKKKRKLSNSSTDTDHKKFKLSHDTDKEQYKTLTDTKKEKTILSTENQKEKVKSSKLSIEGEKETVKSFKLSTECEKEKVKSSKLLTENQKEKVKSSRLSIEGEKETVKSFKLSTECEKETVKSSKLSIEGEKETVKSSKLSTECEKEKVKSSKLSTENQKEKVKSSKLSTENQKEKVKSSRLSIEGEKEILKSSKLSTEFAKETVKSSGLSVECEKETVKSSKLSIEGEKEKVKSKLLTECEKEKVKSSKLSIEGEKETVKSSKLSTECEKETVKSSKLSTEYEKETVKSSKLSTECEKETVKSSKLSTEYEKETVKSSKLSTECEKETVKSSGLSVECEKETVKSSKLSIEGEKEKVKSKLLTECEKEKVKSSKLSIEGEKEKVKSSKLSIEGEKETVKSSKLSTKCEKEKFKSKLLTKCEKEKVKSSKLLTENQKEKVQSSRLSIEGEKETVKSSKLSTECEKEKFKSKLLTQCEKEKVKSSKLSTENQKKKVKSSGLSTEFEKEKVKSSKLSTECEKEKVKSSKLSTECEKEKVKSSKLPTECEKETVKSSGLSIEGAKETVKSSKLLTECEKEKVKSKLSIENQKEKVKSSKLSIEGAKETVKSSGLSIEGEKGTVKSSKLSTECEKETVKSSKLSTECEKETVKSSKLSTECEKETVKSSGLSTECEKETVKSSKLSTEYEKETVKSSKLSTECEKETVKSSGLSVECEKETVKSSGLSIEGEKETVKSSKLSTECEKEKVKSSKLSIEDQKEKVKSSKLSIEGAKETVKSSGLSIEGEKETVKSSKLSTECEKEKVKSSKLSAECEKEKVESSGLSTEFEKETVKSSGLSVECVKETVKSSKLTTEFEKEAVKSSGLSIEGEKETVKSKLSTECEKEKVKSSKLSTENQKEKVKSSKLSTECEKEKVKSSKLSTENQKEKVKSSKLSTECEKEKVKSSKLSIENQKEKVKSSKLSIEGEKETVKSSKLSTECEKETVKSSGLSVECEKETVKSSGLSVECEKETVKSSGLSIECEKETVKSSGLSVECEKETVKSSGLSVEWEKETVKSSGLLVECEKETVKSSGLSVECENETVKSSDLSTEGEKEKVKSSGLSIECKKEKVKSKLLTEGEKVKFSRLSTEGGREKLKSSKLSSDSQNVTCKSFSLTTEADGKSNPSKSLPKFEGKYSLNSSSDVGSIKFESPPLLRALELVKKPVDSSTSIFPNQERLTESEIVDSPMLKQVSKIKSFTLSSSLPTLGTKPVVKEMFPLDIPNSQTAENTPSSLHTLIQTPFLSQLNVSSASPSSTLNSDNQDTKRYIFFQAISTKPTVVSPSIYKTSSFIKRENASLEHTQPHNAPQPHLALPTISSPTPAVDSLNIDFAPLSKSPSISFSAVSIPEDSTPVTAGMDDKCPALHLSLKCSLNTKPKKSTKTKTKSAAQICHQCGKQIDGKILLQSLSQQHQCKNCYQKSQSASKTKRKLFKKQYLRSQKNLIPGRNSNSCGISPQGQLFCSVCHRSFTHRHKLRLHKRWHVKNKKPYRCRLCGKKFRQKAHFLGHRKLHMGDGPYKCSICRKGFYSISILHLHLSFHIPIRPYKCSDCPCKFNKSGHLVDHQKKRGHLTNLRIKNLDKLQSKNENNDICDSQETCLPSASLSSLCSSASELAKTLSTARQEKRQSRMRMLQRHLAGEDAADVGIDQVNKVVSTHNKESQKPISTLIPKPAKNNQDPVQPIQSSATKSVLPSLPKVESQMITSENDHSVSKVHMDLKVNQSFSLGIEDFQALSSGESMQNLHNSNASDFGKIDPTTETAPGDQEIVSDLPPPLLSPENVSSTSSATLGNETLSLPLNTEEPPFLPKVLSFYSFGLDDKNLKTSTSAISSLETVSMISNPNKEETSVLVPQLFSDHQISAPSAEENDDKKEVFEVVPKEKGTKEWENLEKNDDLTSDTFHEQERVIFLPTSNHNNSTHSESVHLVDWPQTIVQCSVEERPDDVNQSQESRNSSVQSQAMGSVKTNCEQTEQEETSETANKRKLSIEEEDSEMCKQSNTGGKNIFSLISLNSSSSQNQAKKPCQNSEKDQPMIKSTEIKQEPCSDIDVVKNTTSDNDVSPLKNPSSDQESLDCKLQKPKKEPFGMSKRNLSRLPSEPVRQLPKRNYKKPQKYFCEDFDYSISFSSVKPKTSSPVSAVTTMNNSSVTVSSPSDSKSASCKPHEKNHSPQVSKSNENSSQNNKNNATNNKINDNVNNNNKNNNNNNNNNNKSNDINKKKSNNDDNFKKVLNFDSQPKESAQKSATSKNDVGIQRSKRKYDMTKRNLKKEMKEKAEKQSREELTKNFLRLRFDLPDSADEFEVQQQYHKKKLLKNATVKKHTVIPKMAKVRKSPQMSPKKCSESHYGLVKMAQADQKPFLSAVTTERKILPAPPKTRREEILENLISYSSVNFIPNDDANNNSSQKSSEELDVRTEPTQLSKLLGSPLAVLPSAAAPHSALPSPVTTTTTHCETPSVTTIATLIPVTNMHTTNQMPIPVTVLANPLPTVTKLDNNQFFMGNLPAPLQENNTVLDQKPVISQILPLPNVETEAEEKNAKDFCPPVLQIKKEVVTPDDEGYGGKQSDGLSGLRITGVTGGVTTHDTIPMNSDAICSNPMLLNSQDANLDHQDWSVTRRRPLRCILVQTEDGFGHSEFTFECCGLTFSQIPELASHLDSSHK